MLASWHAQTKPGDIVKSSRSLLIAGAGDVGGRLAALRAALGEEVIALRRREAFLGEGIRCLRADLASGEGFDRLPRRPDALVFCAAPSERSEEAYRRLFVDGLRRLLDVLQVPRVVFVSSTAVYAQDDGEWVDEQTPALATAFNGRVLREAEDELAAHSLGTVLRLSGIYGPGRELMLRRARSGKANRPRWGNRIHVEDAAAALSHLLALPAPQDLYLGSDDVPAMECDVMNWLREHESLDPVAALSMPPSGRRVSNARLRASGWQPRYRDFQSGYLPMLAEPSV